MNSLSINLALVDDQTLYREALERYLVRSLGLNITASTRLTPVHEQLRHLVNKPIDIFVIDIFGRDNAGLETLRLYRDEFRSAKMLIFSMYTKMDLIGELLDLGIYGYISKADSLDELLKAIQVISNGHIYQNSFLTKAYYWNSQNAIRMQSQESFVLLSERDKKMIRYIWEEKSNKDMADLLHLGVRSIEKLRQDLKDKIGVRSTIGLMKYALNSGLIKGYSQGLSVNALSHQTSESFVKTE